MIPHSMHKNFQGIQFAGKSYAFQDVTRGLRYLLAPRGLSFCMKNIRSGNLTYGLDWSMACQMWLLKCQQPSFFRGNPPSFSAPGMCAPQEGVKGSRVVPQFPLPTVPGTKVWRQEIAELVDVSCTN